MLGYSIINFYNYYKKAESYSELNHFSYIPIEYGLQEEIKKISNYIKENKDVKMLYYSAAIYNIPLDIYNKDLDMFNTGNFGYKGNDRIKKEILNSKDVKYLILKDIYYNNWQTPYDIIEFTKNNKILEGEIGPFNIYK